MKPAPKLPFDGDYQWPAPRAPKTFRKKASSDKTGAKLTRDIERFFEKKLGAHAVLVPSARAGLSMILSAHAVDRSQLVFAPRWSSYCVWTVIGRKSNPTADLGADPDVILAVHKWGQVSRLGAPRRGLVIEDSVDSLFTDGRGLFPNGGAYELLSLPKLIGAFSGGVVLTRAEPAAARLRALRSDDDGLSAHLSYLKFLFAKGLTDRATRFHDWGSAEHANTALDSNGLSHVKACLKDYAKNAAVIGRRLAAALRQTPALKRYCDPGSGRLPPLLAVPCDESEPIVDLKGWMIRRKNVAPTLDKAEYKPAYLLPLHFGVEEPVFKRMLSCLRLKSGSSE